MKNISLEINGVLFDRLTVAENYQEMTEGLENKMQIDADEGMIYVFGSDTSLAFVNENRYLDIDMIMVDVQGKITAVHTMKKAVFKNGETEEEHLATRPNYPSSVPYRYVFELKSGMAEQIGAEVGKRLDVDYAQLYPFRNADNIRYAFQLKKTATTKDWISPLLLRMEQIAVSDDPVRDLILEFTGGEHDIKYLQHNGWVKLDGIDTEVSENVWLQKEFDINDQLIQGRMCFSAKGHFRHLYFLCFAADGAYLPPEDKGDFKDALSVIQADLANSQVTAPTENIEEEISNVTWKLTNPGVKDEWNESQKKFYIWSKEFIRLNKKSNYYRYRLLNGILRFDNIPIYDFALTSPLCAAAELNYQWASAKLIILSLSKFSESTNPEFWNDLGFALDRMNEKEAAFYCFANAWNLEFEPLYANNLWLMGNCIIPELLKKQNWTTLYSIASTMLSAISDKVTVKEQLEVLCLVGLIYEMKNDFEEAETYYNAAWDIHRRNNKNDKNFWKLRWEFPALYQALMRCRMKDKTSCKEYIEAQLKTFPQTPLESGFQNRLPVEYVEGDGHGDHWDCVTQGKLDDPEAFFGTMIQEGKVDVKGVELPEYERGEGLFTQGIGFRYQPGEDADSPVESYFIIGVCEKGDSNQFASAFPVFKKGRGSSIITSLDSMNVWSNALEATVEFSLRKDGGNQMAFFLPDFCSESARLKPDTAYRVELGAFAYSVSRFEEREFKIDKGFVLEEEKLRLRKDGKDDNIDSVSIHMANDFCNIARSFSGWADDISIVAPIESIEKFTFLGNKSLILWLQFDERGNNMSLPVFLKEQNLEDGFVPQVGDIVECSCWLQGWVHEAHQLSLSAEIPEENDDKEDDEVFDFAHSLLCGVRGTDYDLNSIIVQALDRKGKVEDICQCPEALPGDADFSCRINGSLKFVKVMTGYFENEDECREKWQKFCKQTIPRLDGRDVHLLSIVGIKLSRDQYKIYYNGFSKLNPAVSADEDELDFYAIK